MFRVPGSLPSPKPSALKRNTLHLKVQGRSPPFDCLLKAYIHPLGFRGECLGFRVGGEASSPETATAKPFTRDRHPMA